MTHSVGPEVRDGPHAIVLKDVWRTFGDDAGVRALDLEVPSGTVFGLVGPSGSGKTTVVRLVLGTDAPTDGEVEVLGAAPTAFTAADRSRIGYLPQSSALYPDLSLRHNLHLVASLYGLPWRARWWPGDRSRRARRRVQEMLELVDLDGQQTTRLGQASGGEQRRLGLAAAMVHDPELLVLDEPTAGLDPVVRRRIWDRLQALRDGGATVFVTTQNIEEVAYCDLVALLVGGRRLVVDTPEAMRRAAFTDHDQRERSTFDDVFVELVTRSRAARDDVGDRG
jgi:ABC-2 type transport system ATP-binding protein